MKLQVTSCRLQVIPARRTARENCNLQPSTFNLWRAFTLIELLVVIAILGILAALSVPAIKDLGKSNQAVSAARQLLDGAGRARQLAIANRTTVYMVFLPANFWLPPYTSSTTWTNTLNPTTSPLFTNIVNLSEAQLSGYTFISQGRLGDQPGQRQNDWQYLDDGWQRLPDNSFIASWKFQSRSAAPVSVNGQFLVAGFVTNNAIPFPTETNSKILLPYVAFNYLGQLTTNGTDPSFTDEYIPLARGTVGYGYNGATKTPVLTAVTASGIIETPPGNSTGSTFNLVHIDALTGRARLEFQQVQ